jgi:hypothetical protein
VSEAPWQLAWCDICRDGGSYGAALRDGATTDAYARGRADELVAELQARRRT